MKCPYCGHENEDNHCKHCFAVIPVEQTKEKPKTETKKKRKELKDDGT